jgi:hypothetical protein
MRFATPVVLLIAAVLLAGCDAVAAPKPNPSGDAAFVSQMKRLCAAAPALVTINPEDGAAAVIASTDADDTVVSNLDNGLVSLTPSLSSSSPLAVPITDLALMLDDMQIRYLKIKLAVHRNEMADIGSMVKLSLARAAQARSDLGKIGVSRCLK